VEKGGLAWGGEGGVRRVGWGEWNLIVEGGGGGGEFRRFFRREKRAKLEEEEEAKIRKIEVESAYAVVGGGMMGVNGVWGGGCVGEGVVCERRWKIGSESEEWGGGV